MDLISIVAIILRDMPHSFFWQCDSYVKLKVRALGKGERGKGKTLTPATVTFSSCPIPLWAHS